MAKRVQHKPRRRVGLKEMGRRGLSMLMAMIMVISLIQISAFAAGSNHTSTEQIMEGYFTPDDTMSSWLPWRSRPSRSCLKPCLLPMRR